METQLPSPKRGIAPIFGPCLLWPNGWMDQDATWYRDGPRPRRHCARWGPNSPAHQPPSKKGIAANPIFGPCLLWPNGWMDQGATWYGGRPRPRPDCVRWGPSSPERGTAAPPFQPMSLVAKWSSISATADLLLRSSWQTVSILYKWSAAYPQNFPFP